LNLAKGGFVGKKRLKVIVIMIAVLFASVTVFQFEAEARFGKSRSFGSRGSRSYDQPKQNQQSAPSRQQAPAQNPAAPAPPGGGFMRGLGGGILGGLLGGMLFSSLGFGHMGGGFGGSGVGMLEILLLGGLGYFVFRMIRGRRESAPKLAYQSPYGQSVSYGTAPSHGQAVLQEEDHISAGLAHIKQMDAGFDEKVFTEKAMDIFFKIQGAWMNRDLKSVKGLLTDELEGIVQEDINELLQDKRINRLENIAVRNIEITEAWQESGEDFLTVLFTANLLDFTTDEAGRLLEGSKTEPVKFGEFWTFTRFTGGNSWKLAAIQQK
jgi:predicted lipid-binding transport protein (Tim44 family)